MDEQMKAFAEHFNAEMNPNAGIRQKEDMDNMSKFMYNQFISFVKVGFTREEALHLIMGILTTTLNISLSGVGHGGESK